jgi:uncharacterized protein YjbI with pentapeptide repeats
LLRVPFQRAGVQPEAAVGPFQASSASTSIETSEPAMDRTESTLTRPYTLAGPPRTRESSDTTAQKADVKWKALLDAVGRGEACEARKFVSTLTGDQVEQLLAAAPAADGTRRLLNRADFGGLSFTGPVDFMNIRFVGDASFKGAVFNGAAAFRLIDGDRCSFDEATFSQDLYVDHWTPQRLTFNRAKFQSVARFIQIDVREELSFALSTFMDLTDFSDIKSLFLLFNAATFLKRVSNFVAGCRFMSLQRSRLERGGVFFLHGGAIDLSGAELGASTVIAGTQFSGQFRNRAESLAVDRGDWRPRLEALEGTDAQMLMLQDVSLARCLFKGSINLDKLRLEGLCAFDKPPEGLCAGLVPPFLWFWTPRLSLFEERIWRTRSAKGRAWFPAREAFKPGDRTIVTSRGDPFVQNRHGPSEPRRDVAEQLVKTYRALRKGREDAKNEPGAGDFYYGEMEMRRKGHAGIGEQLALWLYWSLSGYGLRPLRSLGALLVLIVLSSYLLVHYGFTTPRTYSESASASLAATVNLEFLKPQDFNGTGQWIRIVMRILGPTLFGLTILGFWGRVKR